MKKSTQLLSYCLFLLLANPLQAREEPWRALMQSQPKAHIAKPVQKQTLMPNLDLYYVQNNGLPYFELKALIKAGPDLETDAMQGRAKFLSWVWPYSGTSLYESFVFQDLLSSTGAQLTAKAESEHLELVLKSLVSTAEENLTLFFDLLFNPKFSENDFDSLKARYLWLIQEKNKKISVKAQTHWQQMLYGSNNPLSATSEIQNIQNLTFESFRSTFESQIQKAPLVLVAQSPYSLYEFLEILNPLIRESKLLPALSSTLKPEWGDLSRLSADRQWVDFSGTQAQILMGHTLVSKHDPDKIKWMVLNMILGQSSLGSRLGNKIRSELGLSYNVSSEVNFFEKTGDLTLKCLTNASNVGPVIDEMIKIYTDFMGAQKITEDELLQAKKQILNQSYVSFEEPLEWAQTQYLFESQGFGVNYDVKFYNEVAAMTLNDLQNLVDNHFSEKKLKVLVVGPYSAQNRQKFKSFEFMAQDKGIHENSF